MTDKVSQVQDIPAEIWIKVLSGLAVVTLALISYTGQLIVDGQNRGVEAQERTTKELGKMNGYIQALRSVSSRNKDDIKEIHVKVDGNTAEINKLKGAK